MNDPRVHGNILVHKHSKRAYSVVHPKVLGPVITSYSIHYTKLYE